MNRPMAGMLVASALFGTALTGTKYALAGFDPYTLLAIQLIAATAALWGATLRKPHKTPDSWRRVGVVGMLEPALAYLLVTFGLTHTTASVGSLLTGLESAFTALLAALVLRERVTRIAWLAIALAFGGTLLLESGQPWGGSGVGNLCIALGVLSASSYTIVVKRWADETDPLVLTAHQFLIATALVGAVAVSRWGTGIADLPTSTAPRYWAAAMLVGVFGYGASFLLFNTCIERMSAGTTAIVLNLIPAFGVATAVVWLGESLTSRMAFGALLIAGSVVAFVLKVGAEKTLAVPEQRHGHWLPPAIPEPGSVLVTESMLSEQSV
jgi:drug/metabolite transporter (DMT)-like permease